MRNLKKTLCLVLALVFVLGLCTVGVGAVNGTDFSDKEEIHYATAVKAMSGLGILVGDDNDGDGKNEFRPADGVTRAQAAKIIAYLVVGTAAEQWPARAEFDDVPADHWAAKYVTYCKYNNIIAGYGNGKFGPDDPVTMVQFARMLLAACGFGLKDEFIGASWDQNVAKRAMTCKLTTGLATSDVDWDKPATREAAAQMAYTTLMKVPQVVLNSTTNDYEEKKAAAGGGTFSKATWDLTPASGYVIANKTTLTEGKGLYLSDGNWYQTDVDEDPDILGHYVTINYRVEGAAPNTVNVAYYVDDECTEVGGAAANEADKSSHVGTIVQFYNGEKKTVPTPYAMSAQGSRKGDKGTYVLDADKKVVSYKYASYFLSKVTITSGKTYIVDPADPTKSYEVKAPAGTKAGDVLTVFKMGEVYTGEAITKEEKVKITQSSKDFYGKWTCNNGAISYTKAVNAGLVVPNGATGGYDGKTDVLKVGDSYTLYFDSKNLCIAYGDHLDGNADSISFVVYIADYSTAGTYGAGDTQYFAQVITDEGKIENLKVAAATTGLTPGDICTVTTNVYGVNTLAKAADAKRVENGAAVNYVPTDPLVDYSNATFIYYYPYNPTAAAQLSNLGASTKVKPHSATMEDATPATVRYTFTEEVVGTATIRRVKAVWFTKPAAASPAANTYIFLTGDNTSIEFKEYKLTNDVTLPYYKGYQDGVEMNDLYLKDITGFVSGFYKYTKSAVDGSYNLDQVAEGGPVTTANGAAARDIYMANPDTLGNYILNGKLYAGSTSPIDLTNVKIVKVGKAAGFAYFSIDVSTPDALQSVILSGKGVYLRFVENVVNYAHSIGGGVIYVYDFK